MKTDIEKIEAIMKAVGVAGSRNTGNRRVDIGSAAFDIEKIPEDLNAIRELEMLVIEKFGAGLYGGKIYRIVSDNPDDDLFVSTNEQLTYLATADAATRITAMLAVIEEGKDV